MIAVDIVMGISFKAAFIQKSCEHTFEGLKVVLSMQTFTVNHRTVPFYHCINWLPLYTKARYAVKPPNFAEILACNGLYYIA